MEEITAGSSLIGGQAKSSPRAEKFFGGRAVLGENTRCFLERLAVLAGELPTLVTGDWWFLFFLVKFAPDLFGVWHSRFFVWFGSDQRHYVDFIPVPFF